MNGNKHNVNDKLHCKHCGAELAEDSVFCEQCGKRVKPNKWLFVFIATALLLGVGGLWFYLSHRDEGPQPKLKPTYTISVKSSDEAMGTVNGGGTYDTIITVTIEALANEGYRFVSWNAGNKERQRKVVTDHNQEYEAQFEIIPETPEPPTSPKVTTIPKFLITVESSDPYMGTVKGGGEWDSLSVIKIEAQPKNGYQFVSWTDGNKSRIRKVKVLCNQEYTARFQKIENKPIETYDLGWGNYTGPMKDGKPDGRPGKVTVTRTHDIIDASGNKITVYSGEKITATKFVNGLLKYGEIHRKDDSHLIFQAKTD